MTVQELISKLELFDQDCDVRISSPTGGDMYVNCVALEEKTDSEGFFILRNVFLS